MKLTKEALKKIIKEELESVMTDGALNEVSEKFIMFMPGQNEFHIMLGGGKSITYLYKLAGRNEQAMRNHIASIAGTNVKQSGSLHPQAAQIISQTLASQTDAQISPDELMSMPIYEA